MNEGHLKLAAPEQMNSEELLEWIKGLAKTSAKACHEAEQYYKELKKHHENMAALTEEMVSVKSDDDLSYEEKIDHMREIGSVVEDVIDAIAALTQSKLLFSEESSTLEEIENEVLRSDAGKELEKEFTDNINYFLSKYNERKAQLDLNTQEEVADITGISRRYISQLESGKHKPQFKTLKKLADGFGVDVSYFSKS